MKRIVAVCALTALVAACGNGPRETEDETDGGGTPTTPTDPTNPLAVPEAIAGDLDSISFDASTNTLTVTGLSQDGVPLVNEYRHVSTSFVDGYETFTGQNDPLGRHATAFVASRDGVQAGVVLTGPQFNTFFGGAFFERSGAYVAPTAPESRFDVTYYGNYAAGLNTAGPETDIFPTPGVDEDVNTPEQAAYVRGLMFVNVDLNEMSVEGEIYDRTAVTGAGNFDMQDIVLIDGTLTGEGTFSGNIELDESDISFPDSGTGQDIGDFAGVIGGPSGEFMAGGTRVTEVLEDFDNEIEIGVFVLDLCVAGNTDPICVNALQP
ncbi:hypothetical protein [uncultured Tateyamaria sp.]|uniref:hypothetical protein n=1 Tax=uncultured Tateyamaria sp. TaxID=455651 RepID=UPI00261364AC|nr:hypothetical protein [uncultured Tateyamaria sp.]